MSLDREFPIELREEWRKPTEWEQSILDRLLEADFSGRDELHAQVHACQVRVYDKHGCLEMRAAVDVRAHVRHSVPVEARTTDQDGMPVDVLLFVKAGTIAELEFNRGDGGVPINLPPPSDWAIHIGSSDGNS